MSMSERKTIDLEQGWDFMQKGITKLKNILEGLPEPQFSSEDYMMLYTTIYNMCTQKPPHDYSQQLYDKYKESFEEYIVSTLAVAPRVAQIMVAIASETKTPFLAPQMMFGALLFKGGILKINSIHCKIDFKNPKCYPNTASDCNFVFVPANGISCLSSNQVLPSLREKHDEFMLRELVKRWANHKIMVRWLSRFFHYLDRYFIARRSLPPLNEVGLTCFRDLVYKELNGKVRDAVISLKVQHELLSVYANQLLEKEHSGCHALLRDDKVEDLSRMFRLFSKIPRGLDPVSSIFKQHVTTEGMALVKHAEDAASNKKAEKKDIVGLQEQVFVRKVIELHDKYLAYVNDCFQNHTLFHKALKEAFEVFCNKGVAGSSSAELLASFCDNILKKGGSEKLSDEAIEETLEKVVKLLAYISDKDLFAEFYRKKLARRLLFDKSANDDHERSILTKLKQQCGGQFTSKMEGMVTDLTLAKENQTSFEEYLSNNPNADPGIDLTVTVLTTGFWPSYKSFDLNLPAEMASALLLFNSSDRLSYSEIMTQLNLSDDDVIRLLHSLSCAKYKILNKEPNTKTILSTDYFEFNSKFTDKMRRIKIPLPPVDEKKKVIEDVDKDRRYAIDASIVRIMKSRKVLGYQQLVMECVEQLGRMFKPDVKAIKKRIEDLISRDYLERDKDNANMFKYLA
ncbi:hypothetical protein JHK85_046829 [Glycine max]|nr:hypothetical protein JHK85_046829 [Glycine max]